MKKLLSIAALLALPLLAIAQTELKINADIRGRSCLGGLRFCSVLTTAEIVASITECKKRALKPNETTLVIKFNKTMLSETEQKRLLNATLTKTNGMEVIKFVQEEDMVVDKEALELLGISQKYNSIKKGNYPVIITSDCIKVTFQLWQR